MLPKVLRQISIKNAFILFVVTLLFALAVRGGRLAAQDGDAADTPSPGPAPTEQGPGEENSDQGQGVAAAASLTYYTSRALFNANVGNFPVEDFEEANVAPSQFSAAIYGALNNKTNNTVFSTGEILPGIEFEALSTNNYMYVAGAGLSGNSSKYLMNGNYFDYLELRITYDSVTAVGMDIFLYAAPGGQIDIYIYGQNDQLLGTTVTNAEPTGINFWGVASDQVIKRIKLETQLNNWEGVDNVVFGPRSVLLPAVGRDFCSGVSEVEPNDTTVDATGPIVSGATYHGSPDDLEAGESPGDQDSDYYWFNTSGSGTITAVVTDYLTANAELQLYDSGLSLKARDFTDDNGTYTVSYSGGAGKYYVRAVSADGHATGNGCYQLTVTFP